MAAIQDPSGTMPTEEPLKLGQSPFGSAGNSLSPTRIQPMNSQDADMTSESSLTLFLLDTLGPGIAEPAPLCMPVP